MGKGVTNTPKMFAHHDSELARQRAGYVGLENELVVLTPDGNLVRDVEPLLRHIWKSISESRKELIDREFQVWQLELKTRPHSTFKGATDEFEMILNIVRDRANDFGFRVEAIEYLDTDEKFGFEHVSKAHPAYMAYAHANPHKVDAMCRVASSQQSIGMGTFLQSLRAHNRLVAPDVNHHILENWTDPRRIKLFDEIIFPGYRNYGPLSSGDELISRIDEVGCLHQLPRFYPPNRIHSVHPTDEERRPGATTDIERMGSTFSYIWPRCYPGISVPMTEADLVTDRRVLLAA